MAGSDAWDMRRTLERDARLGKTPWDHRLQLTCRAWASFMPVLEGASFAPAARGQAESRCGFRQPLPARHHGSDPIHHPNAFARDEEGCRMFPGWTRQSRPPAGRADGVSRAERVRSAHATTRQRAGSRAPIDCSASAEAFEQRVVEPCSDFSRAPLTSRLVQREAVAGGIDETDRSRGSRCARYARSAAEHPGARAGEGLPLQFGKEAAERPPPPGSLALCSYAFTSALGLRFFGALGGAAAISKASVPSFTCTFTSPPWSSLPNSNSSASGCLTFSWISRPIGRAP